MPAGVLEHAKLDLSALKKHRKKIGFVRLRIVR